jgi:hypothetical protein
VRAFEWLFLERSQKLIDGFESYREDRDVCAAVLKLRLSLVFSAPGERRIQFPHI